MSFCFQTTSFENLRCSWTASMFDQAESARGHKKFEESAAFGIRKS